MKEKSVVYQPDLYSQLSLINEKLSEFKRSRIGTKYLSSFVHFIEKDKLAVHKIGQIYNRGTLVSNEPLVLFNKRDFECYMVSAQENNKFYQMKMKVGGSKTIEEPHD